MTAFRTGPRCHSTHKTHLILNWLAKRPRYHLHFTPTSASWLNLVERWFALLTDKHLRRGAHRMRAGLRRAALRVLALRTSPRALHRDETVSKKQGVDHTEPAV